MCTKDICGRQYSRSISSIDILINIWSTSWSIHVKTLSTLDQQSVDSRPSGHQLVWINQKLVDCWPTVDWDVDGVSMECQVSTKVSMKCWSSIDRVSIKYRSRVLIEGIDRHSTVDAISTHDPENFPLDVQTRWAKLSSQLAGQFAWCLALTETPS